MATYKCNVSVDLKTETSGVNPRIVDVGSIQIDLSDWLLTMPAETIQRAFRDVESLEEAVAPYVKAEHDGGFDIDLEYAREQVAMYLGLTDIGPEQVTDEDLGVARERYSFHEDVPEHADAFDLRVIVATENADGVGDFVTTTVSVSPEQYRDGDHYDLADEQARDQQHDPRVCFDEADGPDWLFRQLYGVNPMPDRKLRLKRIDAGEDPVPTMDAKRPGPA